MTQGGYLPVFSEEAQRVMARFAALAKPKKKKGKKDQKNDKRIKRTSTS